jgi:hypothetical protein
VLRVGLGILIGVAASAVAILVYRAVTVHHGPSAADRRLAAERVMNAVKLSSSCCKRTLRTTCTSTTAWSICVVTVYIPEPLDACQDWSVNVHHHFVTGPEWRATYGCVHS